MLAHKRVRVEDGVAVTLQGVTITERELWRIISGTLTRLQRHLREAFVHPTGRILRVYLWAVLHDRPTYWAAEAGNWAGARPPRLMPDQSTLSRRLRRPRTARMLADLLEELEPQTAGTLVRRMDGKPLTVARHSGDKAARFGRGAGGIDRGYKLHAVYGNSNKPAALRVTPLNVDERNVASELIGQLAGRPGYLLADAYYDANHLYDKAGECDQILLTPRRYKDRGLGRHRHSPHRLSAINRLSGPDPFARDLLATRPRIETRLANLCNFGGGLTCLPPWVRGRRVEPYVHAKIAIRLARDQRLQQMRA